MSTNLLGILQFEEEAAGFPPGFEFVHRKEEVFWDYVTLSHARRVLPVRARFVVAFSNGEQWRVEVEYKNHRHFESSTNLSFGAEK